MDVETEWERWMPEHVRECLHSPGFVLPIEPMMKRGSLLL